MLVRSIVQCRHAGAVNSACRHARAVNSACRHARAVNSACCHARAVNSACHNCDSDDSWCYFSIINEQKYIFHVLQKNIDTNFNKIFNSYFIDAQEYIPLRSNMPPSYYFLNSYFHRYRISQIDMNYSIKCALAKLSNWISFRRKTEIFCIYNTYFSSSHQLPHSTRLDTFEIYTQAHFIQPLNHCNWLITTCVQRWHLYRLNLLSPFFQQPLMPAPTWATLDKQPCVSRSTLFKIKLLYLYALVWFESQLLLNFHNRFRGLQLSIWTTYPNPIGQPCLHFVSSHTFILWIYDNY